MPKVEAFKIVIKLKRIKSKMDKLLCFIYLWITEIIIVSFQLIDYAQICFNFQKTCPHKFFPPR